MTLETPKLGTLPSGWASSRLRCCRWWQVLCAIATPSEGRISRLSPQALGSELP